MKSPLIFSIFAILVGLIALSFAVRGTLGRDRPDLAAWVSFDDGLWSFTKTYDAGSVGPFAIGDSRANARSKLSQYTLLEQDEDQLKKIGNRWRISLPAKTGGYVTYTVEFNDDKISTIRPYYSVFAGL